MRLSLDRVQTVFGGTSDSVLIQYAGVFEPYPQLPWTQFDDDQRMVLLWTSVRRVHGGFFSLQLDEYA